MDNNPAKAPIRGVIYALAAALLFGMTTPLAKTLLEHVAPLMLSSLFYLGASMGLGLYLLVGLCSAKTSKREASLKVADLPWLCGATLCGGILAPVLLMTGLAVAPATSASLFLNLEGVFTALIAWFVFGENFDRRIALGFGAIVAGSVLLSVQFGQTIAINPGVIPIVAACLGWAIDNNLTGKIAGSSPAQITCIKGLVAGLVNLAIALTVHQQLPGSWELVLALVVGCLGYGVSLMLFVLALRHLGTARTGAYFAMAPFVSAGLSIVLLHELVTSTIMASGLLMALGLYLHLSESHSHEHSHELVEHEHRHVHDLHHHHDHDFEVGKGAHSHWHKHELVVHDHVHYPDMHHKHAH